MICFDGKQFDIKVTPNHRMLVRKRTSEWTTCFADQVKHNHRFLAHADFVGKNTSVIEIDDHAIDIRDFLSFVGYYVSEGFVRYDKKHYDYFVNIDQSPTANPDICKDIEEKLDKLPYKYSISKVPDKNRYRIHRKKLCEFMQENFGNNSHEKRIPAWIKNLSPDLLLVLLTALNNGDGTERINKNTKKY